MSSVLTQQRLDAAEAALGHDEPSRAATKARDSRRFAPWSTQALELTAVARLAQGRLVEARKAYREITRRDPRSWVAWAHLADAATGAERLRAIEAARSLNPLYRSPSA
jgi:cytochrome c-type biogenesis protein CcmH/NrfG